MRMGRAAGAIILLAVLSVIACGCSPQRDDRALSGLGAAKEYNDVVALYNRMAMAFTELARLVDSNVQKPDGFGRGFWDKYQASKDKVLARMADMREHDLGDGAMAAVAADIRSFMDSVEQYLEYIDDYKNGGQRIGTGEFVSRHKELYEGILEKSKDVVKRFNIVYEKVFIGG
jgi:hypothetical protein